MTDNPQTDRPEVDDPRVLALAKARQHRAHSNPFNFVCPPWDGLTEQEQHLSLLDARNYLHAALDAGLVPAVSSAVSATPAPDGQAAEERRDRYAKALAEITVGHRAFITVDVQAEHKRADAVIAIADAEQTELRRKLAAAERIRENADFHLGQEMARRQLAEKQPAEAHRLALSEALGLGTGAPWDAIRERAAELAAAPPADRAAVLGEAADAIEGIFIEDENPDERSLGFNEGLSQAIGELRRMAAEIPADLCGRTTSTARTEYPPCARPAGHREAYCRSADGTTHFLALYGPKTADRAAVLREAADALPEADLPFVPPMDRRRVADWLRRLAAEAPEPTSATCPHCKRWYVTSEPGAHEASCPLKPAAEAPEPATQAEAPTDRRETVLYFLESRVSGGKWESSSSATDDLAEAARQLARRRDLVPDVEYRLAQHTTTVTVRSLPACLDCRHWRCDGDGPCGALLNAWQRCTCTGPTAAVPAVGQTNEEA